MEKVLMVILQPNVAGIVMAGLADFKTELSQSDMLDQRLAKIIVKIVDVSYGGDNGFNQVSFCRAQIRIDIYFAFQSYPNAPILIFIAILGYWACCRCFEER